MKTVTYHTVEERSNYVDQIAPAPEVWEWVKGNSNGDVHVFEDTLLPNHVNFDGKVKIAAVVEAPAIYDYCRTHNPSLFHPYEWIIKNHQHFSYVMSPFTFMKDLVGDRYLWMPAGGNRIQLDEFGMYEKERSVSIVASHKQWTVGHKMRHQIVNRYPGKIETYGSGYNEIVNNYNGGRMGKILAIAPYHYSFAIMNSKADDYFTEILTDVLAVGTIPIWWGTDNIGKYFNPDGIIAFNTIEELDALLPTLTPELYQSKLAAIQENVERAKAYNTRFDWIYNNYSSLFGNLK